MNLLNKNTNCLFRINSRNLHLSYVPIFFGEEEHNHGNRNSLKFSTLSCCVVLGSQNQTKRSRKRGKAQKDLLQKNEKVPDEYRRGVNSPSSTVDVEDVNKNYSVNLFPSRTAVLQACTVTSGLIGALGLLVRQVSHFASQEGWPVVDCSSDITFSFELWHLELITGSVILVSSCRFLLLKIWPDFAESSEAANQQVLTSLEPIDYLVVAFLPGIAEELLFRGSVLPLLGVDNWTSIFAVAALFGVLHVGSGRKYSFATWATFVGLVYGYTTALSSSVFVPMASHALNNLIGGIIWRYSSNSSKQIEQ